LCLTCRPLGRDRLVAEGHPNNIIKGIKTRAVWGLYGRLDEVDILLFGCIKSRTIDIRSSVRVFC